jgi:2,3-bisphosphoglycerate-independent phosphoglycerate mutase
LVTGDHVTPCELGIHAADPVPTLLWGAGIEADATTCFHEAEAVRGALPARRAIDLLAGVRQQAEA